MCGATLPSYYTPARRLATPYHHTIASALQFLKNFHRPTAIVYNVTSVSPPSPEIIRNFKFCIKIRCTKKKSK